MTTTYTPDLPADLPPVNDADYEKERDRWTEPPIPLTRRVTTPDFPIDSLPGPIAEMVRALSTATQADPAMAGTSSLSVLAACCGGAAEIEVRPGWREPCASTRRRLPSRANGNRPSSHQ